MLPNTNEQLKLGISSSCSAAAVFYISWIFSPDNSRIQEIVSNFLIRSAESWTEKQSAPSILDEEVAGYVKKPKKPKYHHHKDDSKLKGAVDYRSTALWLEEFQKQMSKCLVIEKCTMLMKFPLGILLGWSGSMDQGVPEMLLHYAATGRILLSSNPRSDAPGHNLQGSTLLMDECYEESISGALLVFQLTDIVERLSASLFEDEESGQAFIHQFQERTRDYLVKCVKRLKHFQAHKRGNKFLSDLLLRLLRWKSQARELTVPDDFNQLISELNSNILLSTPGH